jgi:hypothetical protein
MPDTILKRWNGSSFEELYPKTTVTQISASGTPSASTFLRGDGQWATPADSTTLTGLGITATSTELNYVDGVTSNVQTQLNAKAALAGATFTGDVFAPRFIANPSSGGSDTAGAWGIADYDDKLSAVRDYITDAYYPIYHSGNSNVWEPLRTRGDATNLTTTGANGTTGGSISTGVTLAQGDTIMMEVSDTAATTTGNTVSVVIFTLGATDSTPTSITQGVVYRTSYSSSTVHYDYFFKVSHSVTSLYFDDSFRITFTDSATASSIITQTGVTLYVGRVWRLLI